MAAKLTARQRLEDSHAAALDKRTSDNAVERSDLLDRASAALAAKAEQNKLGTSNRREMALKKRAEVFRSMEELRKERAVTGALSKDRTSSMAAEVRRLDLEARRFKVAARRSQHQHRAESMSAAALEAGKPRDTPYFHGLYGNFGMLPFAPLTLHAVLPPCYHPMHALCHSILRWPSCHVLWY